MNALEEQMVWDRGLSALTAVPLPEALHQSWRLTSHERLDWAYQLSPRLSFDDQSRLVFFSDCHRGNNGRTDLFKPNKRLFLDVLKGYLADDYTYIEVGDGDELWQNRCFTDVYRAHRDVYDLLHRFQADGRLHLLIGNHDSQGRLFDPLVKDGLVVHQGLVLHHTPSGLQLFATHGHQAAPTADHLWRLSRLNVRTVWKWVQALGFVGWQHVHEPEPGLPERHRLTAVPRWISDKFLHPARDVEHSLRAWATTRRRLILCGHTHLAACPRPGEAPYFNTGSCVSPGFITGIEFFDGMVRLVKWTGGENGRYRHTVLRSIAIASFLPISPIQESSHESVV
jgi:UDP-2,3-diacylglucosamine pyrophosphatase LpxH